MSNTVFRFDRAVIMPISFRVQCLEICGSVFPFSVHFKPIVFQRLPAACERKRVTREKVGFWRVLVNLCGQKAAPAFYAGSTKSERPKP
jgi:hypothetical protein